jgi:hypothetical protein
MRAETVQPTAEALHLASGQFDPLSGMRVLKAESLRRLVQVKPRVRHPSFDQLVDALRPWSPVGSFSYDWRSGRCRLEVIAIRGEDDATTEARVQVALLGTDWALVP